MMKIIFITLLISAFFIFPPIFVWVLDKRKIKNKEDYKANLEKIFLEFEKQGHKTIRTRDKLRNIHENFGLPLIDVFHHTNEGYEKMTDNDLNQLQSLVIDWAEPKGLLDPEKRYKQFIKLVEEVGELGKALIAKDQAEAQVQIKDGIGDATVVLIILAHQCGMTLNQCLEYAYDQIKNRTGETINGVFVKDADVLNPDKMNEIDRMLGVND